MDFCFQLYLRDSSLTFSDSGKLLFEAQRGAVNVCTKKAEDEQNCGSEHFFYSFLLNPIIFGGAQLLY